MSLNSSDVWDFIDKCETTEGVKNACIIMMGYLQSEGTIKQSKSLRDNSNWLYQEIIVRELKNMENKNEDTSDLSST